MEDKVEIKNWSRSGKILFRFVFAYILIFINSFSFPHSFIPDIGKYASPFFETLVKWFGDSVLKIKGSYTSQLISDSTGMYLHALLLVFISAGVCGIWSLADRQRKNYDRLFYWFLVIVRYYLAMQLLAYGFSKIFKWQFYLPEPNTLFTTIANTPRDLLYWTTMGVSRPYVLFLGVTEIVAAALLLFKRTQLIGGLSAFVILLNVVCINFCFDVSVKLYSCFLLLLSVIVIAPHIKGVFNFFILNKFSEDKLWRPESLSTNLKIAYKICKTAVICLIVCDGLAMYFASRNFNDDKAPRPFLHGAYDVTLFVKNGDTLKPLINDTMRWKRIFIHRKNYFITQLMNDDMQDYVLAYDSLNHQLIIENTNDKIKTALNYSVLNDSMLVLKGKFNSDSINVHLKKINADKLPVLQNELSWTIDE